MKTGNNRMSKDRFIAVLILFILFLALFALIGIMTAEASERPACEQVAVQVGVPLTAYYTTMTVWDQLEIFKNNGDQNKDLRRTQHYIGQTVTLAVGVILCFDHNQHRDPNGVHVIEWDDRVLNLVGLAGGAYLQSRFQLSYYNGHLTFTRSF